MNSNSNLYDNENKNKDKNKGSMIISNYQVGNRLKRIQMTLWNLEMIKRIPYNICINTLQNGMFTSSEDMIKAT